MGGREHTWGLCLARARGQDIGVPSSWEGRAARAVPFWASPPQSHESRKPSEQAMCANPSHTVLQRMPAHPTLAFAKTPVGLSTNPIDHLIHRLSDTSTAYGGRLHETPSRAGCGVLLGRFCATSISYGRSKKCDGPFCGRETRPAPGRQPPQGCDGMRCARRSVGGEKDLLLMAFEAARFFQTVHRRRFGRPGDHWGGPGAGVKPECRAQRVSVYRCVPPQKGRACLSSYQRWGTGIDDNQNLLIKCFAR